MKVNGKRVLIYGLGRSGRAAVKLLRHEGAEIWVYDDKQIDDLPAGVSLVSNLEAAVELADLIVVSPSVSINKRIFESAVIKRKVIGELELAYQYLNSGLIAVTGTNGKTTATLLINEIINRAGRLSYALGNIGIPLSEKVLEMTPSMTAVVEVSTFQLESVVDFSPDIAVLLNATADHLDRHGTVEAYRALKAKIFENQINRDIAVLNADDEAVAEIEKNVKSDRYFFSTKRAVRGAYSEQGEVYFEDTGKIHICKVSDIRISGEYNLRNALAAITVCILIGINPEIIRIALKSFEAPDYRCAVLGEKSGKRFYNDSKATNISATLASVRSLDGRTVLILGGQSKGENYDCLFENLSDKVVHVFVSGDNATELIDSAVRAEYYNISYRATLNECVNESLTICAENVLFSPAAASFDRFKSYKERGAYFDKLYAELK